MISGVLPYIACGADIVNFHIGTDIILFHQVLWEAINTIILMMTTMLVVMKIWMLMICTIIWTKIHKLQTIYAISRRHA